MVDIVNKSTVEYIQHMGSDLTVVNAARVSYDAESYWEPETVPPIFTETEQKNRKLSKKDENLIAYLARGTSSKDFDKGVGEIICRARQDGYDYNEDFIEDVNRVFNNPTHWSPFSHCTIQFRLQVPIFVARQLGKHQVGLTMNEVSRRYIDSEPVFYIPDEFRGRAINNKQGSESGKFVSAKHKEFALATCAVIDNAVEVYNFLLDEGVAPEQARMVLPQNMMTQYYWTGSLFAFARVCQQRLRKDSQKETQEVAEQIHNICKDLFPVSWKYLVGE